MENRGRPSMMERREDERRSNDVLDLRNNRDGSIVPLMEMESVENPSTNRHDDFHGNVQIAMPDHDGPADRSGQVIWRPDLPASDLCQNVTYGQSDSFSERGRMDYVAAFQEMPPRVSLIDDVQPVEQQHRQFGQGIQPYGQVPLQGPTPCGPSAQPMAANPQNAFLPMHVPMEGRAPPGFVPLQINPSAKLLYNQQQGCIQQGLMRAPFLLLGPGAAAMNYQNFAYYQSYYQGPASNTHQQMPKMFPTIPNLARYPTPPPPPPPQDSRPMIPGIVFQPYRNLGLFPQMANPTHGYLAPPPENYGQFQGPAQVNAQVFGRVSSMAASYGSVSPGAYGPVPLPSTICQANPAASSGRMSGTRRRVSRVTSKLLHQRTMCQGPTRPMGKTPSLDRSCEPVVEPPGYENLETALAALTIGCTPQPSTSRSAPTTRQINADVNQDLMNILSRQTGSGQANGKPPSAIPMVSHLGNRSWRSFCELCRSNKETVEFYTGHILKDSRGVVRCPVLRNFTCPRCRATGDKAHTLNYCPLMSFNPGNENDEETDEQFGDESGEADGGAAAWARAVQNTEYEMSNNAAGRYFTSKR